MTTTKEPGSDLPLQQQESVVIRFAGDSGDGMQITGNQYATTSAVVGNDLATMPDFPAEIRAPAGTRALTPAWKGGGMSREAETEQE